MEPKAQNTNTPAPFDDEQINLRAYAEILLKRKWAVIIVFLAAVGATAVFTLRQQKVYSASTSLVIDMAAPAVLGDQVRDVVDVGSGSYWYSKEYYETQYRIIKSRAVAQKVVDQLGLQGDAAFLGIANLPPDQQQKVMERVDAAAILQGRVNVEPVKDSRVVNIRIEDTDADRAALLANAVANAYKDHNLERKVEGTKDATVWLEDQLVDLKKQLQSSEVVLFNFKKDNDLVYTTLENKQTIVSSKLIAINDTLTRVRTKKAELDARVKAVKQAKASGDLKKVMELGIVANNAFVNQLKVNYMATENEVAELREKYGEDHPKRIAAEQKLKTARSNLQAEIDAVLGAAVTEYDEATTTEKNLDAMLDGIKKEAFEINKKEIDYKRLAREEENNQRLYDMVLKRTKELDLSGLLRTNNIRILDAAKVIKTPVKPNVSKNIGLAAVLGMFAGIALAFLLEYQDRSVKGHAEIEAMGLNFLGLIPSIPGGDPQQPSMRDLYIGKQPKSTVAECCRTIRTNLLFMSPEKPVKTLLVTSAGPQEGKTTSLVNLGITLAQSGNRVLLVDTDMRRPRLHKSFGVANELGMSSLIVGDGKLEDAIKSTEIPGLFVLPSGPVPPNPAELLHTDAFKKLTAQLGERFDRILFDSPPIGAVTDALVLANQMDGAVMVLKMFRTDRDAAERAVRSLQDANAKVLGAVLNDVDLERRQYGYYLGYYYGYGRYYGEGKGQA